MDTITLFEEYRLIEKSEGEINGVWKGTQLLLFFLSFVFGTFCTFCFHVLIYMFNEKCVLFPKLVSLRDIRRGFSANRQVFEYIAIKDIEKALAQQWDPYGLETTTRGGPISLQLAVQFVAFPADFAVTTQWMDTSTCYLPTYVPLLSGICGLVWTTMFLMCSSGSRALTGLQRPWRILPAVFVFSLGMGCLCIYTSVVTHNGLHQLCIKLGEVTGTATCSYTINVATVTSERQIRGVHQATRLTIVSAWLHTFCWLGAALLTLIRVILVVDFRLVRVRADLQGNIEKMLERHEKHIRTDEFWLKDDFTNTRNESLRGASGFFQSDIEDPQPHWFITQLLEEIWEHVDIYVVLRSMSSVSRSIAEEYVHYRRSYDEEMITQELFKRKDENRPLELKELTSSEERKNELLTHESVMSLTPELQRELEERLQIRREIDAALDSIPKDSTSLDTLIPETQQRAESQERKSNLRSSQGKDDLSIISEQTPNTQKVRFDKTTKDLSEEQKEDLQYEADAEEEDRDNEAKASKNAKPKQKEKQD